MLFHENPQLIFFVVGWNVRLEDEPVVAPNQCYKLRMDQ